MNIRNYYLTGFCALALGVLLLGCSGGSDSDQSEENAETSNIAQTWEMGDDTYAFKDNVDVTDEYSDLSIRFTQSGAYTVQGDPDNVVYPTGTWAFAGDGEYSIIYLNDTDVPVYISYPSDGYIDITFTLSENELLGSSRVAGITGEYTFRLTSN